MQALQDDSTRSFGQPPALFGAVASAAPSELAARTVSAAWSRDAAVAAIGAAHLRVARVDGVAAMDVFA